MGLDPVPDPLQPLASGAAGRVVQVLQRQPVQLDADVLTRGHLRDRAVAAVVQRHQLRRGVQPVGGGQAQPARLPVLRQLGVDHPPVTDHAGRRRRVIPGGLPLREGQVHVRELLGPQQRRRPRPLLVLRPGVLHPELLERAQPLLHRVNLPGPLRDRLHPLRRPQVLLGEHRVQILQRQVARGLLRHPHQVRDLPRSARLRGVRVVIPRRRPRQDPHDRGPHAPPDRLPASRVLIHQHQRTPRISRHRPPGPASEPPAPEASRTACPAPAAATSAEYPPDAPATPAASAPPTAPRPP